MPTPAQTESARTRNGVLATVILPAYNEAAGLAHVLADLDRHLDDTYEVLVVDDGSTDDTAGVAGDYPCRLVRHSANQGKGAAIRTGIAHARSENVVIMDADASYPATAIDGMVELLADHDLVRGNREPGARDMPPVNRVGNWLFDRLLAISHGLEGTDHLSGLYGLRREAAQRLGLESTGFDIEAEIGIRAQARGLRVVELPISYLPRVGDKKLSPWRDGFRILARVIVLLLIYKPWLSFIIPGLLLMLAAIAGAVALSAGPVETPYFGLSIHSFIVAALGVLAAFQLIVFGIAATMYGVEAGRPPPDWLLKLTSQRLRLAVAAVGLVVILAAAGRLIQLIVQWGGQEAFTETRALVLTTTFLVLGLQALSAVLFLSIFSGRLKRAHQGQLQGDGPYSAD